ncbi:MAG: peptide chain release factor N(5)-glutamine methyltransferase [Oceanicaulis sp.]
MRRSDLIAEAARRLAAAGVEDARDDARRLLAHAGGLGQTALITQMHETAPAEEAATFEALIARRERREPLSQILGTVGFWTLDLKVTADVLTPRADTETIVEAALGAVPDRSAPVRVLDVATGSGAIVLALLSELPNASGVATDLSAAALAVARENAAMNGLSGRVSFVETSWADGVDGPFDLLVCNPPYIATGVIGTLEPEVRDHEPHLALDGGADGLGPYPHLFEEARRLLTPGGTAVFEIGYDQGEAATTLARNAGWRAELMRDLAGRDRAVVITRR